MNDFCLLNPTFMFSHYLWNHPEDVSERGLEIENDFCNRVGLVELFIDIAVDMMHEHMHTPTTTQPMKILPWSITAQYHLQKDSTLQNMAEWVSGVFVWELSRLHQRNLFPLNTVESFSLHTIIYFNLAMLAHVRRTFRCVVLSNILSKNTQDIR